MDIRIPDNVNMILEKLNSAGYEAFVVGGCVRDTFMGKSPNDWDICTSARPNEIKECFGEFPTVDTGIKHGTVTVIVAGRPVEVTTYRIDGEYHDNRHPVSVEFTENIEADLARRDFTVNAMAYSPVLGVFDPFGGRQDIKGKCIRCVGKPTLRFEEDALRIMRGLRFASVLGFDIEEETLTAMRACKDLMKKVSVERIHVEFSKLIMGKNADLILENCRDILQAVIPEMADSPVGNLPLNLINRLGALFPEDTEAVLRRLKYDNYTIKQTLLLNDIKRRYGAKTVEKVEILKILKNYGEDTAKLYFEEYGGIDELNRAMEEGACWKRADLQVSGRDVMEAGFRKGPEIGEVLNELLEQVIEGKLENERKNAYGGFDVQKGKETAMTEKMQEKMKEKKIERVCQMYFSPTGNTLSVTRGILFGAMDFFGFKEFEKIDFTLPDKRNMSLEFGPEYLVIIGVPTYAGRVPNKIMPFIREQIKGCGATGVAVVTYGNRSYDESLKELTLLMKANGFKVAGAGAFPAEHAFAGKLAMGRPDENDLNTAREFGRAIAKKTQTGDFQEIVIPGESEGVGPYYVPKKADGQPAVFLKAKPKTDREKCTHCGICADRCSMGSIDADDVTQVTGVCIKCQACIKSCVAGAKYFDNEDFISHRKMLEENFAEQRCENVIYI